MTSVLVAGTPMDWPKDSQKFDIYINEEGMYELLFLRQQPKAKDIRKHCCNVLFPHVRQQLSDKSHAMEIEAVSRSLRLQMRLIDKPAKKKMRQLHCLMMT